MSYNAIVIANYVIRYGKEKNIPTSNLKLQKLLYYIQAAFLVETQQRAFNENIAAWKYGPVVEEVYHKFKIYVDMPIEEETEDGVERIDKNSKKRIERIVDSYREMNAIDMVNKTHSEAPWRDAYNKGKDYIETDDIKAYYIENQELIYGTAA